MCRPSPSHTHTSIQFQTAKLMEILVADTPVAPVVTSSKTNLEERASADSSDDDTDVSLMGSTVKSTVAQAKRTYLELHKQ